MFFIWADIVVSSLNKEVTSEKDATVGKRKQWYGIRYAFVFLPHILDLNF